MASLQRKGLQARILTSEEKEKLTSDQALVSDFKQQKLEQEAQKNWDLFYKRNSINFFKNRHWTTREFEELKSSREFEGQKLTILEAGCGVGNCLFPLLEEDLNIFAYACDFSPRAVEYVKQNPLYDTERCKVFQCDLTKDDLLDNVPQESVDIVMLIFVLSAIHPDKMHLVLQNIYKYLDCSAEVDQLQTRMILQESVESFCKVLKPGKSVLFRDYGLYDHTMLRFKGSRKLGENFYVRQDGTRSYFFTEEFLAQLFVGTGYEEVISEYVFRETVNKKEDLCVPRVFLQSKFRKPPQDLSPATLHHQVCGISLNTLHRVPTLGSLWLGVRRRREECEQKLGGRKTASAIASLKPEKVRQEVKQSFRTPGEERLWKTLSLSFGKTLPHFHVEVAGAVSGVWPWR